MPMYDFSCKTCGHRFEKIVRMDDPNPPCPKYTDSPSEFGESRCGCETERLLSRSNFILKGGGWATDGYGK